MASGFVHEVQTLIALGRSYPHIHQRKDEPVRRLPGLAHRRVRHHWYQAHGRKWDLDKPNSDATLKGRIHRVLGARSPRRRVGLSGTLASGTEICQEVLGGVSRLDCVSAGGPENLGRSGCAIWPGSSRY